MKLDDLFAFPGEEENRRASRGAEGGGKRRLIYHSSFIPLVLVSGGVMFGTSKLRVLPRRCDAKKKRCCFNLEPDLRKHEYIRCSIPHRPADALVPFSCSAPVY